MLATPFYCPAQAPSRSRNQRQAKAQAFGFGGNEWVEYFVCNVIRWSIAIVDYVNANRLVDVGLVDVGLVDVGLVDVGLVDVGGFWPWTYSDLHLGTFMHRVEN